MGEPWPRPGTGLFHSTFSDSLHLSGGFSLAPATPLRCGPRHHGQSFALTRISSAAGFCCGSSTSDANEVNGIASIAKAGRARRTINPLVRGKLNSLAGFLSLQANDADATGPML